MAISKTLLVLQLSCTLQTFEIDEYTDYKFIRL
jgi:hypothetical protein